MWHRASSEHGIQRILQIMLRYNISTLIKIFDSIVDAPQVQQLSGAGEDGNFGSCRRAGKMPQDLLFIDEYGKTESEFLRVPANIVDIQRRIGLNGVKAKTVLRILLMEAIHFRDVAITKRTVNCREEDDDPALTDPFVLTMLHALHVTQCKSHLDRLKVKGHAQQNEARQTKFDPFRPDHR
jgi:hypothetical protein